MKLSTAFVAALAALLYSQHVHSGTTELLTGLIEDRILYCLQEGKLYNSQDDKCYAALDTEPCKSDQWWVQRDPATSPCFNNECNLKRPYLAGLGECKFNNNCELPYIFYKGECTNVQKASLCSKENEVLIANLRGEGVCRCGNGWAEDDYGDCIFLYSQGKCEEGYQFLRRNQMVNDTEDFLCRKNHVCNKDECSLLKYFSETIEQKFGCYDDSCRQDGQDGHCCPKSYPQNDILLWYLDRLKLVENTRGVCVRNRCGAGKMLFATQEEEDTLQCFEADDNVINCKTGLELVNGKLSCCAGQCLESFGVNTQKGRPCRRGYFYSRRRSRCVRGWG